MRCVLVFLLLMSIAMAQSVPTGFVVDVLAQGGFGNSGPSAMTVLADGRVLVAEKDGGLHVVLGDGSARALTGIIPQVFSIGDTGVNGLTNDPAFSTNGYVYALYGHTDGFVKLSRFELTGDVAVASSVNLTLGNEVVIIDDIPRIQLQHRGGGMEFGPDGMLYVALGDDREICAAQDPTTLKGHVLRLDVSALPASGPVNRATITPSDNPFAAALDLNERLVVASGLRNPFTSDMDDVTGTLYIGEVGAATAEEVNAYPTSSPGALPSLNYGWPWFEGVNAASSTPSCPGGPPSSPTPPVWEELHANNFFAVILAGVYRNGGGANDFGAAYEGDLFFSDFVFGQLRRITFDSMSQTWSVAPPVPGQPSPDHWATGFGDVTGWDRGPDGGLYAIRRQPQRLERIRPGVTPGGLAYPGTDEDLITTYSVAGSPGIVVASGTDRPSTVTGDPIWVQHSSPSATLVGTGELLVFGSTTMTGAVLPEVFTGLWIDLNSVFLINAPVAGIPAALPPFGFGYAFQHPGPFFSGISLHIQALVSTGTALNGIFASTNGLELRFL